MAGYNNFILYCPSTLSNLFYFTLQKMTSRDILCAAMNCKRAELEYEQYKMAVITKETVYDRNYHENLKELIAMAKRSFWHKVNNGGSSNIASECLKVLESI